MFLGVGLNEILWLALAIVIGGVITGLLAGLFGVGGGSVIVPVLYEVFRALGVPEDGAHAALRRHLDRHHRADGDPLLSHPSRQGAGHPAA